VLQDAPVRLPPLATPLPPGLEEVVCRALAKQRDKRFGSVGELAQALAPYAPSRARESVARILRLLATRTPDGREPSVPVPTAGAVTPLHAGESRAQTQASGDRPKTVSGRKLVWMIAGLVVLVAATARFLSWRGVVPRPAAATRTQAEGSPTGPGSSATPVQPGAAQPAAAPVQPDAVQVGAVQPAAVRDATVIGAAPASGAQQLAAERSAPPSAAATRAPAEAAGPRPAPPPARAADVKPVAPPRPVPVAAPAPAASQRDVSDFGGRR